MSMRLQDAINHAKTFAELLPIAEQLEVKLSFWGRQYIIAKDKSTSIWIGSVPVCALVDRTQEIIHEKNFYRHNYPERHESELLDIQVNRIYSMGTANLNNSNIITRIIRAITLFFCWLFCIKSLYYKDHQFEWNGDIGSIVGLDGHILAQPEQKFAPIPKAGKIVIPSRLLPDGTSITVYEARPRTLKKSVVA